ncbi:MAG: glycoside hydrolase [Bryobacteraceae bacterium]|nr:glycoside hydrolase [Bryobacteraceae bacterium]
MLLFRALLLSGALAASAAGPIRDLDLAADTARQTIVDREAGQYLGHPTTVLLEDGRTILCVYPKGHGRGAILLKRSTDGGRTWSERLPTPGNWTTSLETPTIHRLIDPRTGKKRLVLFSGLYPIRQSISEDDGLSWTPLAPIGDFGGIVAMGDVIRLRDGRYAAFFHDDGRYFTRDGAQRDAATRAAAPVFTVYQTESRDGGLSWSLPRAIHRHPRAHLCEPGLIRSPNGRQLAMLLRENSRQFESFLSFSNDEGATWTEPRPLPAVLTGDRHQAKYSRDGRLLISFRDMGHQSPTRGDWVAWVGRYQDLVDGRPGQYRVRLMKNHHRTDCAYPGVERLPDDTFVLTTYGHWTPGEPPYVVSLRLQLRELDRRARP